jgi:hypothetical protein
MEPDANSTGSHAELPPPFPFEAVVELPFPDAPAAKPLQPERKHYLLAGIESGVTGAVIIAAWFALDSVLSRQYWWAMLNVWGAGVYHNRVFSMGLGEATLAGAATHIFLHAVGGGIWALTARRIGGQWLHLAASFGAGVVWYVILMFGFWPLAAPVVARVSPMPATLLAYVLFGAALSRNASRARQLAEQWKT